MKILCLLGALLTLGTILFEYNIFRKNQNELNEYFKDVDPGIIDRIGYDPFRSSLLFNIVFNLFLFIIFTFYALC